MFFANSKEFFEIAIGPQPENSIRARLLCVKDFLLKLLFFPLALLFKAGKTLLRLTGIGLSASFLLLTLGSSRKVRELFINRVIGFAKDLADWFLLPFAVTLCFFRLFLALFIHPSFYFNAL